MKIGVVAHDVDRDVVREFFELFKTAWEFHRADQRYDVLISADGSVPSGGARLVFVYSGQTAALDDGRKSVCRKAGSETVLLSAGERIPIYGNCVTFAAEGANCLGVEGSKESAAFACRFDGILVWRLGYDLFSEIRFLLESGQPACHAAIPALERHISLVRDLILQAGIPVVEIPPVPHGHPFMVCLTHDVDHPSIRSHRFDHTMFGFLHRAISGSLMDLVGGRATARKLVANWAAALRLPFVHLRLAKDFWDTFDRYLEIESGLGATYFLIPEKGNPGRLQDGKAPAIRASTYGVGDLKPQLERVVAQGCEVGLHGIDAWIDQNQGREECEKVSQITGRTVPGIRMHWLYFDKKSPATLEAAGFDYDSTVGFNGTIGFRAGTAQAYRPLGLTRLMELPLHVMDTALFYPSHLGLTETEARSRVWEVMDEVAQSGGALTINWHDRSIAPERLWDGFYRNLIGELKFRGAWFPTASQAVCWFKKRRSATVEAWPNEDGRIRIKASVESDQDSPALRVRVHRPLNPSTTSESLRRRSSAGYSDLVFSQGFETSITL